MSQPTDPNTADSAGQPWAGRHFSANEHRDDDGSVTPELAHALAEYDSDRTRPEVVVECFGRARLLIPLVTSLLEAGVNERGQRVDKSQELSIVTVAGPDGRVVLPVFSCVETMAAWDQRARPIPIEGRRVALAAVQENAELIVLDPGSPTEFVVRRPAVWAIGKNEPWQAPWRNPRVQAMFDQSVVDDSLVRSLQLGPADPDAGASAPELMVTLAVRAGLSDEELRAGIQRLSERWAAEEITAASIDSLSVRIVAAD